MASVLRSCNVARPRRLAWAHASARAVAGHHDTCPDSGARLPPVPCPCGYGDARRRGLASIDPDGPSPFGSMRPHRPYQSRHGSCMEHRQPGRPVGRSRRIENRRGQSAGLGLPQRRRTLALCRIASRARSQCFSVARAVEHTFEANVPTMRCDRKERSRPALLAGAVRFARFLHRRVRDLGGPSVRAAFGDSLN